MTSINLHESLYEGMKSWQFPLEFPGLSKLADTEIEVKDMQDVLRRMRPELEKAAEDEAKMIREITRDTVSIKHCRRERLNVSRLSKFHGVSRRDKCCNLETSRRNSLMESCNFNDAL